MTKHTITDVFAACDALGVDVMIEREDGRWQSDDKRWNCRLRFSKDGTDLTVREEANNAQEAILTAWNKFEDRAKNGIPLALLSPPVHIEEVQEDIPF
jgi:hypothetical protein